MKDLINGYGCSVVLQLLQVEDQSMCQRSVNMATSTSGIQRKIFRWLTNVTQPYTS